MQRTPRTAPRHWVFPHTTTDIIVLMGGPACGLNPVPADSGTDVTMAMAMAMRPLLRGHPLSRECTLRQLPLGLCVRGVVAPLQSVESPSHSHHSECCCVAIGCLRRRCGLTSQRARDAATGQRGRRIAALQRRLAG
eukprot:COSAG02_NODE_30955_length_542_cov_0.638826_1_plen_137_part_00